MANMLYLSYDGDGCGKKVGRAIMANDEAALHEWSAKIDLGHEIVNHWIAERGGKRISGGGDEGSFKLPEDAAKDIEELRKDYHYATNITISVGIGKSLSEAGRSLLAAKFRGKDQTAWYGENVEKDISKARRKVKKGKASQEEYKLAEAYLEKKEGGNMDKPGQEVECPYCEQTDGIDPDHCKWCHDLEAQAGEDACPYCKENEQPTMGNENDCPFCNETHAKDESCPLCTDNPQSMPSPGQPEMMEQDNHAAQQDPKIQSPDSNNSQAPAGSAQEQADYAQMDMKPPIIGKPGSDGTSSPVGEGQANPMDNTSGAPVEPASAQGDEVQSGAGIIPEEGAHSKEALQAIAQRIESETVDGKPDDARVAQQIDDADVAGGSMEGNVSRPAGYEENTPGDMGLDESHAQEDSPDLSSVLKEGLDNQSDEIEKDKVRDMVGQALVGFKASKDILERAKAQAPQFYQSSIAMLAAMIKMAEMLGLGGGEMPQDAQPGEAQPDAQGQENEWHDPFPTHPDHGGEAKPGHAPSKEEGAGDPKDRTPVGQPVGKLPSKATPHVARTPLPPGAINAKGQQKVIDPKTGKTRFIDRKQGMVQSPTGVPVKPASRGENDA